jgi:hypothetical protein
MDILILSTSAFNTEILILKTEHFYHSNTYSDSKDILDPFLDKTGSVVG